MAVEFDGSDEAEVVHVAFGECLASQLDSQVTGSEANLLRERMSTGTGIGCGKVACQAAGCSAEFVVQDFCSFVGRLGDSKPWRGECAQAE